MTEEQQEMTCPKCGRPMKLKEGKYGPFWACSGYPECSNIISVKKTSTGQGAASGGTYKATTKKSTLSSLTTETSDIVTEIKKTYDEVVAQFANDYPEVVGDPATLQALASTVYIEKNKRLRKEKF